MNPAELLHDAVDEIEPADRIESLRTRVAAAPRGAARRRRYAAGGVVLVAAATAAAVAVHGGSGPGREPLSPVATGPTRQAPSTVVVPAYFVGDTPRGPRLFREVDRVPGDDRLTAALLRLQQQPADADYRTAWAAGSFGAASVGDGVIRVDVGATEVDPVSLAAQQVVYTLQQLVGRPLPVVFSGGRAVTARPRAAVLSRVLTDEPAEGLAVHRALAAGGTAAAPVRWQVRDARAGTVVARGVAASASGSWHARVGLADLPDGLYTFVATADRDSDTRTIIVR